MAKKPTSADGEDVFTPSEMREWLTQEIRDVMKAAELRIKDATDFVSAYACGEIDHKELDRRESIYHRRWGDAIYGVLTDEGMSNKEVLKRLDAEKTDSRRFAQLARDREMKNRGRS